MFIAKLIFLGFENYILQKTFNISPDGSENLPIFFREVKRTAGIRNIKIPKK
jgi:hypothetical protein